jgi:iron(III) transport system substrate-binding protein
MRRAASYWLTAAILAVGWILVPLPWQEGKAIAGMAKPAWQVEWEETVEAAKKEGEVTVYISGWEEVISAGLFQRAFPQIKVLAVTGRGNQITQRILAERRAGKYLADVFHAGPPFPYPILYLANTLAPVRPALILPEVVDESRWWQGRHLYVDPDREYVFRYVGISQSGSVSYNVGLVNPKEFRSFRDFLDLRWKGKVEARDIRVPGVGSGSMRFFYYHPELGPRFILKLFTEMDVSLFRDFRQGPDWLAQAKFAICFFCSDIDKAKVQGLPVDEFGPMIEGQGMVSRYGTVALLKNARHPNAAKVWINWLLSREGQIALQKEGKRRGRDNAPDSLRIDIPKEGVPAGARRMEGIRYLDLDSPERLEMEPIYKLLDGALVKAGRGKGT